MTLNQLIAALQALDVPGETEVLIDDGGCYSYCFGGDVKVSVEAWYMQPGETATYWRSKSGVMRPKTVVRLET
jgi:hypothetical protein